MNYTSSFELTRLRFQEIKKNPHCLRFVFQILIHNQLTISFIEEKSDLGQRKFFNFMTDAILQVEMIIRQTKSRQLLWENFCTVFSCMVSFNRYFSFQT